MKLVNINGTTDTYDGDLLNTWYELQLSVRYDQNSNLVAYLGDTDITDELLDSQIQELSDSLDHALQQWEHE